METSEIAGLETLAAEKSEIQARDVLDQDLDTTAPHDGERGVKRPAEDDLENERGDDVEDNEDEAAAGDESQPAMSKNQMKKLKRQKRWQEQKEYRRLHRKEKRHERQARKRNAIDEEKAAAASEGRDPVVEEPAVKRRKHPINARVPVSIIVDCQFEKYMTEPELVSLANQVTRCYSDNRAAEHPVSLSVSSYGGYLKDRNENVLKSQHLNWKNIDFCEGDFVDTAKAAQDLMKGDEMIDLLKPQETTAPSGDSISLAPTIPTNPKKAKLVPVPEPEPEDVDKSIVYLTADSPYTIDRLEPNTSYVVGGIIDKNREKGLCYKIARERKVRTAKLPIGEFMVLQSRHVLATNHVVEIMLRWLETGDWGAAFMRVIPTRKGGKLKGDEESAADEENPEAVHQEAGEEQQGDEAMEGQENDESHPLPAEDAEEPVPAEVEGDNADEGLEKNALDEQRWSAPPLDPEKIVEEAPAAETTS